MSTYYQRTCAFCGNPFTTTVIAKKYCDAICTSRAQQKKFRARARERRFTGARLANITKAEEIKEIRSEALGTQSVPPKPDDAMELLNKYL